MEFILNNQVGRWVGDTTAKQDLAFNLADNLCEFIDGADQQRWCSAINFLIDCPDREPRASGGVLALAGCGSALDQRFSWCQPPVQLSTARRACSELFRSTRITGPVVEGFSQSMWRRCSANPKSDPDWCL